MIKTIRARLATWLAPAVAPAPIDPVVAKQAGVSYQALALFAADKPERVSYPVKAPVLPPGVIPVGTVAMDASIYDYASQSFGGQGFCGYPHLAELMQLSEYRSPSETSAMEMTRKWIKVISHGDGDQVDKIEIIDAQLKRHNVRDIFRIAAEQDGFFGRAQIFIDIAGADDNARALPLVIDPATIKKGSLRGVKNVEAMWTSPYAYNSTDPMAADFYKPTAWFVMGKRIHASRLLTLISRPMPDMLKPAYNFGGMSMTQLMEPYVNAWLRTRDSVSDLLHSFSLSGISTDMASVLAGGDDLLRRAKLFNQIKDNRGLMIINKESEEFFQFNVPLSGLDKLQAQSQEHMAAPSHTPMVKLLGITPTGLGVSTEGEISVYEDYIAAMQANLFERPLKTIIDIIQLDQFGEIDPAIGFEFLPLSQLDGTELAAVRKSDSDAAVALITAGVISAVEERTRLAADPNSGYASLVAEDAPEVVADPDEMPNDGMEDDA